MNWRYKAAEIDDISQVPEGAIGFIYRIVDENGKDYVGQKQLYTRRKRKFGKKEIAAITDKRKKHFEYVVKESDWITYTGSNKDLNGNIKKGLGYTKSIIQFVSSKKQLSYYEVKEMMVRGVIEPGNNSYNGNISGKYYERDLK